MPDETNHLVLVGGDYDGRTLELDWLPKTMQFEEEVYRQTNVHVPPRHDDGSIRRRVYLSVGETDFSDEEVVDFLTRREQ